MNLISCSGNKKASQTMRKQSTADSSGRSLWRIVQHETENKYKKCAVDNMNAYDGWRYLIDCESTLIPVNLWKNVDEREAKNCERYLCYAHSKPLERVFGWNTGSSKKSNESRSECNLVVRRKILLIYDSTEQAGIGWINWFFRRRRANRGRRPKGMN